jgi:putative spermidine/putrescine transport system ATP-binding protein
MTRITLSSLVKRYDGVRAVDGIDLDIDHGEFVSFLGPSGCGKTTTLRCIAGFEEPDAGSIAFDGADILDLPPEQRDIGMVFQNYALFPHMTVRQNLAFGLEMRKRPKAEIASAISRVLGMVQLAGYEDRYPRQLSGGQQQRIALARALVLEPRLLLLDEPLANLDAKLREDMCHFIRSLQRRVGITTVYVTHDQAEALLISDRVVVMFGGKVHQVGPPDAIYSRPATREVAEFIGSSNFLEATVAGRLDAATWNLDGPFGPIACRYDGALEPGCPVTLLVRPEAIRLEAAAGELPNAFQAEVEERHYLGNVVDYRLACADGRTILAQAQPFQDWRPGSAVWWRFAPEHTWIVGP